MDHRSEVEANFINSTDHEMLRYVGGKISLEMETPKMLWLKKNLPRSWSRAKLLFDLPDFLTWRATGSESRYIVCQIRMESNRQKYIHRDLTARFFSLADLCALSYASGITKRDQTRRKMVGTPTFSMKLDSPI